MGLRMQPRHETFVTPFEMFSSGHSQPNPPARIVVLFAFADCWRMRLRRRGGVTQDLSRLSSGFAEADATASVGCSYCEGVGLAVRLKPHRTMSASKRGSARYESHFGSTVR